MATSSTLPKVEDGRFGTGRRCLRSGRRATVYPTAHCAIAEVGLRRAGERLKAPIVVALVRSAFPELRLERVRLAPLECWTPYPRRLGFQRYFHHGMGDRRQRVHPVHDRGI